MAILQLLGRFPAGNPHDQPNCTDRTRSGQAVPATTFLAWWPGRPAEFLDKTKVGFTSPFYPAARSTSVIEIL